VQNSLPLLWLCTRDVFKKARGPSWPGSSHQLVNLLLHSMLLAAAAGHLLPTLPSPHLAPNCLRPPAPPRPLQIMQLATYLTYFAPQISPRMWTLFPRMLQVGARALGRLLACTLDMGCEISCLPARGVRRTCFLGGRASHPGLACHDAAVGMLESSTAVAVSRSPLPLNFGSTPLQPAPAVRQRVGHRLL